MKSSRPDSRPRLGVGGRNGVVDVDQDTRFLEKESQWIQGTLDGKSGTHVPSVHPGDGHERARSPVTAAGDGDLAAGDVPLGCLYRIR